MCLQYMKLKTKNSAGLRYCYVPCGKCADCRKKMQNSWKFRMNSEFLHLKNQGWNVAFCTLTYSEEKLPHLPEEVFMDPSEYKEIPCFSKADVRTWIDSVRHYCKRHYRFVDGNNIRYFICSEYGEMSHRPHYHALLAWPNTVDYETMHKICQDRWIKNGLFFPQNYLGDAANNCLSFEVVGDASKVLSYCSKYVCKDLAFLDETQDIRFYNMKDYEVGSPEYVLGKLYKDCCPFHLQSKSLGFEPFKNMTDEEKLDVIEHGKAFQGDGESYAIPMYIKNKLFYDPYYVVDETGKRLSLRKASIFFERNKQLIFDRKAEWYQTHLGECESKHFFIQNGIEESFAEKLAHGIEFTKRNVVNYTGYSVDDLNTDNWNGKMYLAYNNIADESCYNVDLMSQWMMRYRTDELNRHNVRGADRVDPYILSWFRVYWQAIDMAYSYIGQVHVDDRLKDEKLINKIQDFFNNICQGSL